MSSEDSPFSSLSTTLRWHGSGVEWNEWGAEWNSLGPSKKLGG